MKYVFPALIAVVALTLLAAPAMADPRADQVLKFQQKPLDGPNYFGHDEYSTASLDPGGGHYSGWFMADDFADTFTTPVVHVTWWGSYMGAPNEPGRVQKFLIAFENDVPAPDPGPNGGFSYPDPFGPDNLYQTVTRAPVGAEPGPGEFSEGWVSPGGPPQNEALYIYNAQLACPFEQEPEKVYWLKIVALVDPEEEGGIEWGWHNRDYTVENTLAIHPPALVPGEDNLGPIDDVDGNPLDVWHFQDDAVQGQIQLELGNPDDPCDVHWVEQGDWVPQDYNPAMGDGPTEIGRFSKDLAFELHTVPEPGTVAMLLGAGLMGLLAFARRRRKN